MPFLAALFIAAAASLSSTAVVVRVLSERGELDTVPGEVATGWLVIQDLAVVPLMILLPALSALQAAQTSLPGIVGVLAFSFLKSALVVGLVLYLGRHGVPKLLNAVASFKSRELFLLVTVGLVFGAALVSYAVGLSAALGAFLAGLLVAETSQNHAVFAEIRPLRDLFAIIFFSSLGIVLPVGFLLRMWPLLVGATAVILLVKWGVVVILARVAGYHRKTAFLVGIMLAMMSEFGFVIASEGVNRGALTSDHALFLVALTFLTIVVSSPLLANAQRLYYFVQSRFGRWVPKLFPIKEETISLREELPISGHVVICGYGRVGKYIGRALEMAAIPFLVVDYNHATIKTLREKGIRVVYGDPADKDVLDFAQVDFARALVIAIPDRHTQEMVIENAHALNRRIHIICRTHHEEDQVRLKALGVQVVVQPEFEAAISIVERLLGEFGISDQEVGGKVSRLKIEHGLG